VFDSIDDLKSDPSASAFLSKADPSTLETGDLKFAYIRPIVGGETLISFTSVELDK
jgi:hypothetical protein